MAFQEGERVEHDFTGKGTVEVENGAVFIRWDEPRWPRVQLTEAFQPELRRITSPSE